MKKDALKQVLDEHQFTGVIVGVRRDEEPTRAKERYFSPRDAQMEWNVTDQPPELWNQFKTICPQNCDESNGSQAGAEFTYWYNVAFPWFGYIWGDRENLGGRDGFYSKIHRRHLFPALPIPPL